MKTKVALLGTGFIADIHMESYDRFVPEAEIVAVFSRNMANAEAFAMKHGIPAWYTDLNKLLEETDCEVVDICLPNFLHAEAAIKAANAGKHVIVEKPLAVTLEEADEMIAASRRNGRLLMYAEELAFAPKFERVRSLVQEGAIGDIYMMRKCEKHSGPHSGWFWDIDLAGGGVLMDLGCHAIAWFRWMLGGNPDIRSVYATMSTVLHGDKTRAEDNSIVIIEFGEGVTCISDDSWAKHGGMEDKIEVYGKEGVCYADLFMGNSALTYSKNGYGYAMEKADTTQGWTFTIHEEVFNQGYPHELKHFIDCVRNGGQPKVTGEDGRAVLEVIYAAYESARTGRKVMLPFAPKVNKPIDLWLGNNEEEVTI
ncbi:Gfo/Idh/MocA family protein [Cohnella sp. REN36]|uniref:Gfo/Idh/MocA family protein n=1 Tax=Cohnella sp. REN36 TaxID=2887347 RepID=UPI001D1386C4|nr:Gfo/Idh/MocA family oxidoreductase [Cohnella sp. REN36]MCC3372325.1 Gfo/Idh/MocA family oxidoreductase [Cohnella sp. REN36]